MLFNLGRKWLEVEDLEAKEVLEKQAMLAQPYIQIYSKASRVKTTAW